MFEFLNSGAGMCIAGLALETVLMFSRAEADISVLGGTYLSMHGFKCRKTHGHCQSLVLFRGFHLQLFLQCNLAICLLLLCVRCSNVGVGSGSKVKTEE